jgi:ribosome biogenesis GTPase / thiamine phosphate phosphatase
MPAVMKGLVMKSNGSWYEVLVDGVVVSSRIKGKLRLDGMKETNPVAVGDWVDMEPEGKNAMILSVLPRTNHMVRQSTKKNQLTHVLAANIDQVILIASHKMPRTSLGFIDRFLVSAESFRIPQIIIFNKTDLLDLKEKDKQEGLIKLYESLGVKAFGLSAILDDLHFLNTLLSDRTTLIAGHSGVGKSTLLNRLSPDVSQAIGSVSTASNKGIHTTTFVEMFRLSEKTFVIDTPGVKEWGMADMNAQEISDYFPEMRDLRFSCKFTSRCLHLSEPQCAVRDAVELGTIAKSRYQSYCSIVAGDDNRK